jgi:hypothetical protein
MAKEPERRSARESGAAGGGQVDRLTRRVAFLLRLFDRGEGPNGTTGPPIRRVPFVWGCPVRPPIRTENPIPKEMDHREIAVRVPMMHEVQLLSSPEPCKPLQPRFFDVVFLVEEDVHVERCRTWDYLNHEEIDWQEEVCTGSHQKYRNEEKGRIVAFVAEVRPRDEMFLGIIAMMKVYVVAEELTAHWMVAELVMHQRLHKWHEQMRSDGDHEKYRKLRIRKEPRCGLDHDWFLRSRSQFTHLALADSSMSWMAAGVLAT